MGIRYKLGMMIGGLSLIIFTMFMVTWYTTSAQKADGLVINLAGRQRMLSQKMSKEVFLCAATTDAKTKETLCKSAENTLQVFDITLSALIDSGKAPLSENLKEEYSHCPKSPEPALSQLNNVQKLWKVFSHHIANFIHQKENAAMSLEYIKNNNVKLLQEMNKAVGLLQKISEKKVQQLIFIQTICMIIGSILMIISILQISNIVRKLLSSASTAKKLSKGDLTRQFVIDNKPEAKFDEMDFLGHGLNIFCKSVLHSMTDIYSNAQNLNNSSTQMRKIANELSSETDASAETTSTVALQAETMSEDMNSVAAAMEELTVNTREIASSTSQMSTTSKNISKDANTASDISAQAVEKVNFASSRVDELGQAALKIDQVSETITDISEQTNLLALNATIEAARAGEAGKGFAVVATEIKNLANQTTEATKKIKENIGWIQGSTESTVQDIKEIAKIIDQVNNIVNSISNSADRQTNSIFEINTTVEEGAKAVQEVSSNIANTSVASTKIASDMQNVKQSISQVSSNSTTIAKNSKQLSQMADDLHEMVNYFTIK